MGSKVISFRFDDRDFDALQALQHPDDKSISQTAARLLRTMFINSVESYTNVDTSVDIREMVRQEVAASLGELRSQVEEIQGK
jgi:hypothetical protein